MAYQFPDAFRARLLLAAGLVGARIRRLHDGGRRLDLTAAAQANHNMKLGYYIIMRGVGVRVRYLPHSFTKQLFKITYF